MSAGGKEAPAERKFWNSPDHVEKLLPFLDASSTLNLAQAQAQANPKKHPLITEILIGTFNWTRFIKRTCPDLSNLRDWDGSLEQKKAEMGPIIEVLKLMGKPQAHLLKLLHLLLDKLPSLTGIDENKITVTCPEHEAHSMTLEGFCLLEEVEAAMDSSEQKIESISNMGSLCYIPWDYLGGDIKEASLSALSSRVERQEGQGVKIKTTEIHAFRCSNLNNAVALHNLVRSSESFVLSSQLQIFGPIGEAGWAALAQACQLPQFSGFRGILVAGGREFLLEGRREDVRALWDTSREGLDVVDGIPDTDLDFRVAWWHGGISHLKNEDEVYTEAEWKRLVQFLDKSEDEDPAPASGEEQEDLNGQSE